MAKQNEVAYVSRLSEHEVWHAVNKPFSDPNCGRYLLQLGTLFVLLPARARLLDLGCGTGWTSQFFARAGYDVVGVDIAPSMIQLAEESRNRAGLGNLTFVCSDYEALSFRCEFDCAVFFESLHHAEDEGLALRKAYEALKPGGICLASEPGRGHHDASQHVIERFGVNEKDMPPEHVVALARRAGFREFRVFPHAPALANVVYERRRQPMADPFAAVDVDLPRAPTNRRRRSLVKRAWGRLARIWRQDQPSPLRVPRQDQLSPWRVPQVDHLLRNIRHDGVVLLQK
jgi:SAM-dependent methyltransferase